MFVGSNYIYVEFKLNDYKSDLPVYITENFSCQQLASCSYTLPKYTMIKFKNKEYDIDQVYNILKIAMNAKEWNVINNIKIKDKSKKIKDGYTG
jgi:hypothetical protein